MDWAKKTAKRAENHLSFVIWCDLYMRFYSSCVFLIPEKSILGEVMAGRQQAGNCYMKLNTSANPMEWDIDSTLKMDMDGTIVDQHLLHLTRHHYRP